MTVCEAEGKQMLESMKSISCAYYGHEAHPPTVLSILQEGVKWMVRSGKKEKKKDRSKARMPETDVEGFLRYKVKNLMAEDYRNISET